ncbi:glycosyltransferase family 2 protein [Aliterella atlantica]|uniref:Glycosyl transferase n=1 Tax=Aliterella atlantica CENA595 TaxID=1618023 RepID=A0A0D8ZSV0_9CYAN|nr:glycosyltransferase family 2 protein [Aliterella atlantica]KJH71838.1 glycosyl transferase [Aliterella atlantica CENA595]
MIEKITPLILTFNEAPNIDRTLQHLTWAQKIVVIDSYSTDKTVEILQSYPQVEVFEHKFESFAAQCNYGLEKIQSQWVLSLDADYILSDELIAEIKLLPPEPDADSYSVNFKYCVFGKALRGTLYPARQVLYRKDKAYYQEDGHAHRVSINGYSSALASYIYHDDRKSLDRWLNAQNKYMIIESKKILTTPNSQLSFSDRIRKQKIIAPLAILFYCLILKQGILDGWAGWYYAFERMLAETLLSIRLIEMEKLLHNQN